jgi:hypothetical protein
MKPNFVSTRLCGTTTVGVPPKCREGTERDTRSYGPCRWRLAVKHHVSTHFLSFLKLTRNMSKSWKMDDQKSIGL